MNRPSCRLRMKNVVKSNIEFELSHYKNRAITAERLLKTLLICITPDQKRFAVCQATDEANKILRNIKMSTCELCGRPFPLMPYKQMNCECDGTFTVI